MIVWIFNHYAVPPNLPGGTRHYDLGRKLVERGHQVAIIASSFHYYMHKETRLELWEKWKIEDINNIKFIWIKTPSYCRNDWRRMQNMLVYALRAWLLGRNLPKLTPDVKRPDVIIGSSPHLFAPFAAYLVAQYYRIPFVLEIRDVWPQAAIDIGVLKPYHPATKTLQVLERILYRKADKIISLLPFAYEHIIACGVSREKIVWIPNGVDLSRLESTVTKSYRSQSSLCIMYLGAHGKANALDTVIHAAKIIQERGYQDIHFVLVGDGPEKSKLMAMVREMRLHNVEFRDSVPKSEVIKVLNEADALLVQLGGTEIYRYGISSNKLFDSMAIGKPVFSSAEAPQNPVKEANCGFVIPPRDPRALADAVIQLYQMPLEEREAMGHRGQEYVKKHHDICKLAQRLEETLLEVVQKERT
ncbi:MAG: glycosyltransferase family 4 protein [Armatimonadetes bacterium]|nr:glycosyltransferase family 4 protein [Armatimonadota bacterium]